MEQQRATAQPVELKEATRKICEYCEENPSEGHIKRFDGPRGIHRIYICHDCFLDHHSYYGDE